MLSPEKNKLLTEVGPGTPMGDLLRRYWVPIAGVSEFEEPAARRIRLFGEDLVLYKDLGGSYGLVQRHCPHRSADLSYGILEECGIRCSYHGWMFDEQGRCVAQPYEDAAHPELKMKDRIHLKAYPVRPLAGLLWAYMGPAPVPALPVWEPFTWQNGFAEVTISEVPCNWLQCQENSIDPVHFEWMHDNYGQRMRGDTGPYGPGHVKLAFDEFDYGFVYRRIKENTDETDEHWTVGRVCLWPNCLFVANHFEWRVPIDDTHTLSVGWTFTRVPREAEPYVQESIPCWRGPVFGPDGEIIKSHVMNQDFMAWVGQGAITDRTAEHLAPSDVGVTLLRRRFLEDLTRIEKGEDPKAIIRDEAAAQNVELPVMHIDFYRHGATWAEIKAHPVLSRVVRPDPPFQAGRPEEVLDAARKALGLT